VLPGGKSAELDPNQKLLKKERVTPELMTWSGVFGMPTVAQLVKFISFNGTQML
jgi:hypothetical protein